MPNVPDDRNAQVVAELAVLHRDYAARLSADLQRLRADAAAVDAGAPAGDLTGLRDRCHRLAGSAMTFGHLEVGQQLSAIEVLLDACLAGDTEPLQTAVRALAALPATVASRFTGQQAPVAAAGSDAPLIHVLEDDPHNADLVRLNLSSFGYRVELFSDTAALTDAFQRQRPDALIVDIKVGTGPGPDGLATAQALLRPEPLPLLVMSRHVDFENKLRAVRCGASGFFAKPVDPAALQERLDQLLLPRHQPPFRVLLADDDADLGEYHRRILEAAGCEVELLRSPATLLDTITQFRPELMVFDLNMPECSGAELAALVRLHSAWAHLPIVFLSVEKRWDRQRDALLSGGDDFLTKPVSEEDFVALVRGRASRARQVMQRVLRDSLTGLLQHGEAKERLARELLLARRQQRSLAVAMIDIDHFKRVNDAHGHPVGDRVIHTLARFLEQNLRRTDLVGRYGGEEFLVVMPEATAAAAKAKLDALRAAFARIEFHAGTQTFHCCFSAGVADSAEGDDASALLARADAALYAAKRAGRDRVEVAPAVPEAVDHDA